MSVLIVGASGGLGMALLEQACQAGWETIGTYRARTGAQPLPSLPKHHWVELDLGWPESVVGRALELADHEIDCVVVCSGVASTRSILECTEQEMEECFAVNAMGSLRTVRALMRNGHAPKVIIVVASSAFAMKDGTLYSLSKRIGVDVCIAMWRALAGTASVYALAPGWMDTRMARDVAELKGISVEDLREAGDLLAPSEVAGLCIELIQRARRSSPCGALYVWDHQAPRCPQSFGFDEVARIPRVGGIDRD